MGLINWIFDFYQQYRIDQLQRDAAQTRGQAAEVRGEGGGVDVGRLEQSLGELALALKTIQRVMVDKGVCSSEEFHNKLRQLDVEDGRQDGRSPLR